MRWHHLSNRKNKKNTFGTSASNTYHNLSRYVLSIDLSLFETSGFETTKFPSKKLLYY